jgi:hypothetical protein
LTRSSAILALGLAAGPAAAQAPLSAIDWLAEPAPVTVAQPLLRPLGQPPAARGGVTVPDVTVTPLDAARPDAVGLLPAATTGLPRDLWSASATGRLADRLDGLSTSPIPAVQALYYTLLLAEAEPPAGSGGEARLLRARLDALRRFGAVDAALALVERAGPASPALFDHWLDLALLKGTETAPCAALARTPELTDSYAARIFCIARSGDWPTAALTHDSARALGVLDPREAALLARFLDPGGAEGDTDLPPPRRMTPLLFRLYEAAGTPLPTRSLPRAYAVADLRGTMGWKAEIEAAERLARTGALPANRLLGLYTERAPAASGGVWARVRAIRRFDTAMDTNEAKAIAAALPGAWAAMSEAGLGMVFATLYGTELAARDLPDQAALAHEIALLSPAPADAAAMPGERTRRRRFLDGLASGRPDPALAATPAEHAIAAAFSATALPPAHEGALAGGRLGEALLSVAAGLDGPARGRPGGTGAALATLRLVGLEDVARRAALQMLLLPGRA